MKSGNGTPLVPILAWHICRRSPRPRGLAFLPGQRLLILIHGLVDEAPALFLKPRLRFLFARKLHPVLPLGA